MQSNFVTLHADYQLCFANKRFLYFTSAPITEQTGKFWDQADFLFFAGEPDAEIYNAQNQSHVKVDVIKIAFNGGFLPNQFIHSPTFINQNHLTWVQSYENKVYKAGMSLKDFFKDCDLDLYLPMSAFFAPITLN